MVQSDEVFVGQRGVIEISIWVHITKGRFPLFVNCHDDVPQTGKTMDVNDDHKDKFEELQGVFHILGYIHAFNNTTKA